MTSKQASTERSGTSGQLAGHQADKQGGKTGARIPASGAA